MGRRPLPLADRTESIAPPAAVPAPPPIVASDPVALEEWRRVTDLLLAESAVAELDRALLSLYCSAYSRWIQAVAKVAETGGPLVTNKRKQPRQNPWLAIARQAARELHQAAAPLGLSPAARNKVKRPGASSATTAALDEFIAE